MKKILYLFVAILFLFGIVCVVEAGDLKVIVTDKRPLPDKAMPIDVPEPATMLYLAAGVTAIAFARRKWKKEK